METENIFLHKEEKRPLTDEEIIDGYLAQYHFSKTAESQEARAGNLKTANQLFAELKSRAQSLGDDSSLNLLAQRFNAEFNDLNYKPRFQEEK